MGYFPYFLPPSLSASTARAMEECSLRHSLGSWVAFRGNSKESGSTKWSPPLVARRARLAKMFEGDYGWIGNILHDFFEGSLYSYVDEAFGRSDFESRDKLYEEAFAKFEVGWTHSLEITEASFTMNQTLPRAQRAKWLTHHALERMHGRAIDPEKDAKTKEARREWMLKAAVCIHKNLLQCLDNTSPKDWFVIEGKVLKNGSVLHKDQDSDEARKNELAARHENAMPSFIHEFDLQKLMVFCTIDFAYVKDGKLYLVDLKTGKRKEELHRRQLELYGYFAQVMGWGFKPEDIILKLIYPQNPDKAGKFTAEYQFSQERLESVKEWLTETARDMLKRYKLLTHHSVTLSQLRYVFPEYDSRCLFDLRKIKRGEELSKKPKVAREKKAEVVKFLLKKLSPPELVSALRKEFPGAKEALGEVEKQVVPQAQTDNETVNRELIQRLIPSLNSDIFLSALSIKNMLIPLSTEFTENEGDKWLERKASGKQTADDFLPCLSCQYSWFCEPGMRAIAQA